MSFDRLARYYDSMEYVLAGTKLERARAAHLPALAHCQRILSVGEGHGRFAALCARLHPEADLVCIDSSKQMLTRAAKRLSKLGPSVQSRVTLCHQDVLQWQPRETPFDAVVTCFFLDCFPHEDLGRIIKKLTSCCRANAVWLNVDFSLPTTGLTRTRARFVHWLMYAFFRSAVRLPARSLAEPGPLLEAEGWRRCRQQSFEWGLITSTVWTPVKS